MHPRRNPARPGGRRFAVPIVLLAVGCTMGCGGGVPSGSGPGGQQQSLALTPEEELEIGRQAFRELKRRFPPVARGAEVERVRKVGQRVVKAAEIEPLQREINFRMRGYEFEWEFEVLASDHVNAVCLPAGKVAVFTGLLRELEPSDEQLAAVLSHEIAHALAHHASERLARQNRLREAADDALAGKLSDETMQTLIPWLGSMAHNREQESEADHIGVFLMTFAGYDPQAAVTFWQRMQRSTAARGRPPEILSDHPSNERRIEQLRNWVPMARRREGVRPGGYSPPE